MFLSIRLYTGVQKSHEPLRGEKRNRGQAQEEAIANQANITEKFYRLQGARHFRTFNVVEDGIGEYEKSRRPSDQSATPPPTVVLGGQLKIRQGDRDASCDRQQDDGNDEQNSEKRIILSAPQSGENVI